MGEGAWGEASTRTQNTDPHLDSYPYPSTTITRAFPVAFGTIKNNSEYLTRFRPPYAEEICRDLSRGSPRFRLFIKAETVPLQSSSSVKVGNIGQVPRVSYAGRGSGLGSSPFCPIRTVCACGSWQCAHLPSLPPHLPPPKSPPAPPARQPAPGITSVACRVLSLRVPTRVTASYPQSMHRES